MTPLSATQYFRAYYPIGDSLSQTPYERQEQLEQSCLDTLRPFESVPMITIDILAEAWPAEYAPVEQPSGPSKESSATTSSIPMPPSLVELTFVPALNHALQTGETDPFMFLPGNLSKTKETLRAHNPLSAIDLALLSRVVALEVTATKSIDLSHFSLTGEQLIELLSAHESVEVLNISHISQTTADDLRQSMPVLPNLRRLVVLHIIPDGDVLSLLSESPELFYRIDSFIHFAFLRHLCQATYPAVFFHITTKESEVSIASHPWKSLPSKHELEAKLDGNARAGTSVSNEELLAKENDIKSEYANRRYNVFDVKPFFQELVKEGRPAPSSETLNQVAGTVCSIGRERYSAMCHESRHVSSLSDGLCMLEILFPI